MKKVLETLLSIPVLFAVVAMGALVVFAKPVQCTTIQDGTLVDSVGNPLSVGYDQFGYNYQAHLFNGTYDSSDRNLDGTYWGQTADYVDDNLMMKWSDSWIANKDCNGDSKLDRGLLGATSDGISRGWLTNQVEGDYLDIFGASQHYTYFTKIGWTGPGSPLWGEYSVLQEIYNDPAGGATGPTFKAVDPGLGIHGQWTEL